MKTRNIAAMVAFLTLFAAGMILGGTPEKLQKEFTGKDKVKINAVSGDVIVNTRAGKTISVEVTYDVTPEKAFTPVIREQGKTLRLKEEWQGHHSRGRVTWNLTVPPETEIVFEAASGDISASGLKKSFEAKTASGDIELSDMSGEVKVMVASGDITLDTISGDINVHTASGDVDGDNLKGIVAISCASGDIEIRNAEGEFDLSCASGEVDARTVIISEASEFSTASGDVSVTLAKTPLCDVTVSSASGDAVLDYNGNRIKGFVEMEARKKNGRIVSPITFDNEEEYTSGGQKYVRKTFSQSGDTPMIHIHTASGKAELRK